MPKNLLKRNVLEPRNLEKDNMYLKYGYKMKSEFVKYSIHFTNSTCEFYIYRDQFPEYIIQKISSVPNLFSKGGGEDDSEYRMSAESIPRLEQKIKDVFSLYLNEYIKIKRNKKIMLSFRNDLSQDSVNIGIKYIVFIEKVYFGLDGNASQTKNVSLERDERLIDLSHHNGELFDYSEELENKIKSMQKNLSSNMKTFVDSVLKNDDFLLKGKDESFIKKISQDARKINAAI